MEEEARDSRRLTVEEEKERKEIEEHKRILGNGKYCIKDKIANGAVGTIINAHHIHCPEEQVAIKLIVLDNPESTYIFKKEVHCLEKLKSTEVVQLLDHYVCEVFEENFGLLVMERMDIDLFDFTENNSALTKDDKKRIFKRICKVVESCHFHDVYHLDLKLENILLKLTDKNARSYDSILALRLCDFGGSFDLEKDEEIPTCIGTQYYQPPEVVQGDMTEESFDPEKIDSWSLGILLHILLTSSYPYIIQNNSVLSSGLDLVGEHVDPEARDLLSRLLQVEPQFRLSLSDILKHPWLEGV